MALTQGMKAVVATFDRDDRFAPFVPERVQDDSGFRKGLEAMPPEEYAQVMRDTIYALFDGPYPSLGATVEMSRVSGHQPWSCLETTISTRGG